MHKLTTNFLVIVIALFALSVINLITVFTYRQIQELREANEWVAHTHQVIETSDSMFKNALLMSAAGKAFMASSNHDYILEFNNYSNQAFNDINLLKQLTANNPTQHGKVVDFESQLKNRTDLLTRTISTQQKNALDDKTELEETNKNLQFLEKLNEMHNSFNEEEKRLLMIRTDLVHEDSKNVVFFTMLGDAISILILVGGLIIIIYQLKLRTLAENKLQHLAYHDMLTGLANRAYLDGRINEAIHISQRHAEKMALLFIDIDNFKDINDKYGHDTGDYVLQSLATRLLDSMRNIDTVCRLGGDEFIIILASIRNKEDVESAINKITKIISKEIVHKKIHHTIKVSIGISLYPDDGKDTRALMKNADIAMYHAKEKGGNNHQYYQE